MNFDPYLSAAILTGVFNAALAFAVLRGSKTTDAKIFGLLSLSVIVWTISNYLAEVVTLPLVAYSAVSLTYASAITISAIFLHFALLVGMPIKRRAIMLSISYSMCGLFALLSFSTLIVSQVHVEKPINIIESGPFLPLYIAVFLLVVLTGIVVLTVKIVRNSGARRLQLGTVLIGLLITIAGATATNLIMPYFTDSFVASRFGPNFTIFFLVFSAYSIIRQRFFSLKILATEFLVFFLDLLLVARIFLSNSLLEAAFSFFVSIISIVLGILLIRSVRLEVARRLEIEKLNRQLGDFLRFGTHELRAPLGGIRGYTSLILDGSFGELNQKLHKTMQKIQSEVDHLLLIVETFLDANRARQGNLEVVLEPTEVDEAIQKATETLSASFELKKLKLLTKLDKDLPKIQADPRKIQIILGNVLSNSLKYTEKGTVEISATQQDGFVDVKIKDTGIGIPLEVQPHLFTQFERGSDRAKKMATGSGIGLYLSRKLITAMGGEITIVSPGAGKGTTATLRFKKALK